MTQAVAAAEASEWRPRVDALVGKAYGASRGWFEVNEPMIRIWCEAMGLDPAVYLDRPDPIAPPTMLQVWTMNDIAGERAPGSARDNGYEVLDLLTAAGFPGVVAVNCEQSYDRPLRLGDRLSFTSYIESVSPEKTTGLGAGVFVEQVREFHDQEGGRVATMRFRLLKFKPAAVAPPPPQPGISQDTQFFWDGLEEGEFRIQRCTGCGRLRHPPGPACPACHSLGWDFVVSSGNGTVHSFIVAHHPKSDMFPIPNPMALVTLDEGTRLVAGFDGTPAIGMRVEAYVVRRADSAPLPRFRELR